MDGFDKKRTGGVGRERETERHREREREYGIQKNYSVRPQPLLKWCKLNTLF